MIVKNKNILVLTAIILFAALARFIFLDRIPTGITNDELHFVLNAKSVYLNFTDISGNWNPLSFSTIPNESSSELTFLLTAPIIGPLKLNLFNARLPYVLFSLATIILIYLISLKLFDIKIALFAAFVAAINPWSIFVSRTSFDAPIASFFFLLTFYILITQKKWKVLFALIPTIFAFYTYIGTKILLLPFILITTFFCWIFLNRKKYTKQYLILNLSVLVLVLNFFFNLRHQSLSSRVSELSTFNDIKITNIVEATRNQTVQSPLKNFMVNKYTVYGKRFLEKYINNFSTDILFIHGDHTYLISLWQHGYFYYFDFILILLGLASLYSISKPKFILITSLILLSPIPEAIRSDDIPSYAFHSSFQYPYLYILIGLGFVALINWSNKLIIKRIIFISLSLIYIFSFINFSDIYFFRYPIYQSEGFNLSHRIVSNYIKFETNYNQPIYILTKEPDSFFRNYLFYSNKLTQANFNQIEKLYNQKDRTQFDFNNIHFTNDSEKLPKTGNYTLIVDKEITPIAFFQQPKLSINKITDQLEMYSIYSGHTCRNSVSNPINKNELFKISDFVLEKQTENYFCTKFISQ